MSRHVAVFASWLGMFLALSASAQVVQPRFDIPGPNGPDRWMLLDSSLHTNVVLTLQASTNLVTWQEIGKLHEALYRFPDPASPEHAHRFYRLSAAPLSADDDWKNQVLCPDEPFRSSMTDPQDITWVKFSILLNDPVRVYYQDSQKFPFHYDFATRRLPPFLDMDHARFDAVSLRRTNQQVVLGAVLYPPANTPGEYGVQFVGLDAYTPEEIGRWFDLVEATTYASNGARAFYIPTFEQSGPARTNAEAFRALGIPVASVDRWVDFTTCYSTGWALGRLKYFPAAEVTAAFADGRLQPGDVLLTDGVPADTPLVAGILTLTPSTPNSHTAILSRSFGIPFAYLPDPDQQAQVQAMVGHKVIVRATVDFEGTHVKILDVEQVLDPSLESDLLALKVPEPIDFRPKEPYGAIWASTDLLVPADIRFFGGKAANYSLLRRSIPTNCPEAIGLSFDLWDAFLDQPLPQGQTLREEIRARLAPYTNYPPDIVSLKTNLAAIRNLFTAVANFNPAQREAITNLLGQRFTPARKIRFRSSTNVEDSENFTGAGLYDSYSGCLLDDLDSDTAGPSHCEPTEPNERGVFRAIRRVYASFYNDDAVLERLLHRVDENKVAMGVLVHHSFPDEEELANGVALPSFSYTPFGTMVTGDLVTQLGAEPVTNPNGNSVPETVYASRSDSSLSLTLKQYSSLVPLGAHVMEWQADYAGFMDLFSAVALEFREFYPAKSEFTLDFEYKKDVNLGLVVKQVREVPAPGATNSQTAFLLNEPVNLSVLQAEGGNVFANHRLKSLWNLQTHSWQLTATNLVNGIYADGTVEFITDGALQSLSGPLNTWPNASNSPSGDLNYWTTGTGLNQRTWALETTLTTNVFGATPPILTQADFPKRLTVHYATPVPVISESGVGGVTTDEMVSLELRPALGPGAVFKQRTLVKTNVVNVQTSYYWPKRPERVMIYTAPLLRFVETRITGLTAAPIVLTNAYSQTYCPGHHNITEEFVFEPRLDPSVPSATLAQLNAANIQLIYIYWPGGGTDADFYVLGFDRKFRKL